MSSDQPNSPGSDDSFRAKSGQDGTSNVTTPQGGNQVSPYSLPSSDSLNLPDHNADSPIALQASDGEVTVSSLISWSVILLCTLFLMGTVYVDQFMAKAKPAGKPSMAQSELIGRMSMGMKPIPGGDSGQLLEGLDTGPVPQRLARIILVGETDSFGKAASEIDSLRQKMVEANYSPTKSEQKLIDSVQRIIQDRRFEEQQFVKNLGNQASPAEGAATDSESTPGNSTTGPPKADIQPVDAVQLEKDLTLAKENLGFAGELAEAWQPGNKDKYDKLSAKTESAVWGVLGIVGMAVLSLGIGGILLILGIVLIGTGTIRSLFHSPGTYGHIYLETFALWIFGFIALQLVTGIAIAMLEIDTAKDPTTGKLLTVFIFWTPLLALGWIFIRHPAPGQAFKDIGFTSHGIFGDIGAGVATYLACLPLLLVAMISTVALTNLVWGDYTNANPFAPNPGPSHPIQDQFGGGIFSVLFLYFVAAVSAPIVEETVFRGLFFRYLRDSTNRYGWWLSVIAASTVNAFFFAAIHPQGLLGIPPLLMLGVCMSLSRQWREGLVAPMAIHALHNGTLVTVMSILMA